VWETNGFPGLGLFLDYHPTGRWLATGHSDAQKVSIWDARSGQLCFEIGANGRRTGHVRFSPDGHYLVSAAGPGGIKIWEIQHSSNETNGLPEAKLLKTWRRGVDPVFSPDSHFLAFTANTNDSTAFASQVFVHYLWDFLGSSEPNPLVLHNTLAVGNLHKSFTPDSHRLITLAGKGEVVTVDTKSGSRISSFRLFDPELESEGYRQLLLSPDGSMLAVTTATRRGMEVRDPQTGKLFYQLPDETALVSSLAWSPDSPRLAIARSNGNVAIWSFETVKQILAQTGIELVRPR
jgi:WD40 repeat protein